MVADALTGRPLRVDRLSYRWREELDRERGRLLVVRHELDAGRLTVALPPDVVATADLAARAVRLARGAGWSTTDHFELRFAPDPEPDRPIEQPDADALFADEALALGVPSFDDDPHVVLQVLFTHALLGAACLTFRNDERSCEVELTTRVHGERRTWRTSADGDWLTDTLVMVLATPAPPAHAGLRMDALPTRVAVRSARATWSADDDARSAVGPVRAGALAAWRMASSAFAHRSEPLRALEQLHGPLAAPEPPWKVTGRTVRVWGRIGGPEGIAFVDLLGPGPWVIDARGLIEADQALHDALKRRVAEHDAPIAFIGWAPTGLPVHASPESAQGAAFGEPSC